MEKLVIIILVLAIMVFTVPNHSTEQPPTPDLEISQSAVTEQIEEAPKQDTEKAGTGETKEEEMPLEIEEPTGINSELIPTESELATEERTAVQEIPIKTEELKNAESGETVKCVDEGDQNLAEYKPQIGCQPNPFENAPPTEIIDQQVEDIISEGEDRPGEGKYF